MTRSVGAAQAALIFPAALFLTSALVGAVDSPRYDLARFAQSVVSWYTANPWTLPVLILMTLASLISGGVTIVRLWNGDPAMPPARPSLSTIPAPIATLWIAAATVTSAAILGVIALHVLAD